MSENNVVRFAPAKPLIYFIDDEMDILDLFRMQFQEHYEILCFFTPTSAIEAACDPGARRPDVIVTDYRLPKMNGLQMIHEIATREDRFQPKVILLSGNLDKDAAIKAANQGITKIIEKPFNRDKVHETIEQLLLLGKIDRVRQEFKEKTHQLQEMYTAMRLILDTHVPNFEAMMNDVMIDPGHGAEVVRFEDILVHLEKKIEDLAKEEKTLAEQALKRA